MVTAGTLKVGDYLMIKASPCKIVSFKTAKISKHGGNKAIVTGIDIFTSAKKECTFNTSDHVACPVVDRTEYLLMDVDTDGFMSLLTEDNQEKSDVKVPLGAHSKELRERIQEAMKKEASQVFVTLINAVGTEKVVAMREMY